MSAPLTNIRVFVQWTQQTVFAGEDIECQITFKNIANTPTPPRTSLHPSSANGSASASADRQRKTAVSQIKDNSSVAPRSSSSSKGHRTTLSLNVPAAPNGPQSASGLFNGASSRASKDGNPHKRSVSIISIGASEGGGDDFTSHGSFSERPRGGARGHARSASLQMVPRRHAMNGGPPSGIGSEKTPFGNRSDIPSTHESAFGNAAISSQLSVLSYRQYKRRHGQTIETPTRCCYRAKHAKFTRRALCETKRVRLLTTDVQIPCCFLAII